jgi:phospholipase/lecithinase/hemolysin
MQALKTAIFTASTAAILLASTAIANASSFSSVVVYGDSLSDNGNLYNATIPITGGTPPPPYYMGRFSNGPVAVEQLAAQLGVPLADFAWAGATTGIGNSADGGTQTTLGSFGLPGMVSQALAFHVPPALVPTSLFIVWGGADDFESGGSASVAVADIDAIVASLQAQGATHILVPGLPDLGLTPEFNGSAAATLFSQQFNQGLLATLPTGATYYNTFALLDGIISNPSAYGFTNVTQPCFNGVTICANPSQYLFWDAIHPTTAADAILAQQFAAAATPEPSTILMLGTGIAGFAAQLIRKKRAA